MDPKFKDKCPYERDTGRGRRGHVKRRQRYSPRPRIAWSHQMLGKWGAGGVPHLGPSEGTLPCEDSWSPDDERVHFCCQPAGLCTL